MSKYLHIISIYIDEYFVYRLNFLLWRIRVDLNLLLIYFLWSALYLKSRVVLGYDKDTMLTYVLLMSFLSDLVFSSKISEVSVEIVQGNIMNRILKPFSYIQYLLCRETADKIVNVACSAGEIAVLLLILQPRLIKAHDLPSLTIAVIFLVIGMFISFFISFCISMVAFWTPEIWSPRFIYMALTTVLAGTFFPLDVLPPFLYHVILSTPFPYMIFVPVSLYLKGDQGNIAYLFSMSILWLTLTGGFSLFLWKKGMRDYSFFGK